MSKDPESVPFVRRVLQISQTDERWFLLAQHAAVADQCSFKYLLYAASPTKPKLFTEDAKLF